MKIILCNEVQKWEIILYPLLLSLNLTLILFALLEVLFADLFYLGASKPEFLISVICIIKNNLTSPIKYTFPLLTRCQLIWNLGYGQLLVSFCVLGRRKKYKQTIRDCKTVWSLLSWSQISWFYFYLFFSYSWHQNSSRVQGEEDESQRPLE